MPVLKDPRYEVIAQKLADGLSQTDAYMSAFPTTTPSSAHASASRLLAKAKVGPEIEARRIEIQREREAVRQAEIGQVAAETGLSVAWVLDGLKRNFQRAMQEVPVRDSEGNPTGEYRYEGSVANKSLELIGKEFGMFRGSEPPNPNDTEDAVTRALAIRDAIDATFAKKPGGKKG